MATKSRYGDRTDVVVVEYDPAWPGRFERECELIAGALGDLAIAIEHIGSTAVPGLPAKPFIDIMVGVGHLSDGEDCIGPLDKVGYEFRGDGGFPDHYFWRKGDPRQVQLHLVEHANEFWKEHIAFRDALRADLEFAAEYGELKTRLAFEFPNDKVGYNKAKEPFIRGALDRLANA